MIADPEQSALLRVATKADQHLIGCAAGRLVGLAVCEHAELPCRLLWTIPKGTGEEKVEGQMLFQNLMTPWCKGMIISGRDFSVSSLGSKAPSLRIKHLEAL